MVSSSSVRFDEHTMWVELIDGRTLGVPLAWFPRLLKAMPAQRDKVKISHAGLHWDEIDEDISIEGLLTGRGDVTHRPEHGMTSERRSQRYQNDMRSECSNFTLVRNGTA